MGASWGWEGALALALAAQSCHRLVPTATNKVSTDFVALQTEVTQRPPDDMTHTAVFILFLGTSLFYFAKIQTNTWAHMEAQMSRNCKKQELDSDPGPILMNNTGCDSEIPDLSAVADYFCCF